MKFPETDYPTLVEGRIEGQIRCEALDGSDLYLPEQTGIIRDLKPFEKDGKTYAITHLQKKSKKGFLIMEPFIIHTYYWWHLQEFTQNPDGGWSWKPGTERGVYARTPGWRFDTDKKLVRPWVFSKGYAGGHWD